MKFNDGSNFFYNLIIGVGGLFHFFGLKAAMRDKREIDKLKKEKEELKAQLEKCQKINN